MFERFTDRARRVVVLAQEEARALDHDYIGTEHLLLGLLRVDDGVAAKALDAVGVKLDAMRTALVERSGRGATPPQGHMPFSPRAKQVLELGLREALQLGHSYVGTEHILLGLLREGEGVAAQMLTSALGDDGLERIRQRVYEVLRGVGIQVTAEIPERLTRMIGEIRLRERVPKPELEQLVRSISEEVSLARGEKAATPSNVDDLVVRLEAIEARLSAIERMLREGRGESEAR